MKNTILFLSLVLTSIQTKAETNCFLAKENNQLIKQEGSDCKSRYAPESTFKIALSLMGYDSDILQNETHPE
jgi:beta-lactamase class D